MKPSGNNTKPVISQKRITDYAIKLQRILEERCQANPRYSLRAFSRDLKLTPSQVSLVLSGKQGLSEATANKICKILGFSKSETELFCLQVLSQDSRSKAVRKQATSALEKNSSEFQLPHSGQVLKTLDHETFKVLADWYHIAILELAQTPDAKANIEWISKRLFISRYEAQAALDRLLQLNLIQISEGRLKKTDRLLTVPKGIPSESIRKFNRQLLEKAIAAIATQSPSERCINTVTVAINPKQLPLIFDKLSEMTTQFHNFLESLSQSDHTLRRNSSEVYSFASQFFRLTNQESHL